MYNLNFLRRGEVFPPREELERAVEEYRALLQELGGVEAVTTEILQ